MDNNKFVFEEVLDDNDNSKIIRVMNKKDRSKSVLKLIKMKTNYDYIIAENECILLSTMNHPNVIKMKSCDMNTVKFSMELEYAIYGDLLTYRSRYNNKMIDYQIIRKIIRHVSEGLKYIHNKGVIHRDIKLENILVFESLNFKISDFGLSIQSEYSDNLCGTLECMSPEMIQKKRYSYDTDIWSLGVLLYELIYIKSPFNNICDEKVTKSIITLDYKFPDDKSTPIKDLIKNILKYNNDRFTLDKILQHEWMTK